LSPSSLTPRTFGGKGVSLPSMFYFCSHDKCNSASRLVVFLSLVGCRCPSSLPTHIFSFVPPSAILHPTKMPTNRTKPLSPVLNTPSAPTHNTTTKNDHMKLVVPLPGALANSGEGGATSGFMAKLQVKIPSSISTRWLNRRPHGRQTLKEAPTLIVTVTRTSVFSCSMEEGRGTNCSLVSHR